MTAKGNYFSLSEMTCKDGTPYPSEFLDRWARLQETLNAIREQWGAPIRVISGYRTVAYNKSIGGAEDSQHTKGTAADLRPTSGSAKALHALILRMFQAGELPRLGGLGAYPTFVHVDVRAGKRLAQWSGVKTDTALT